MALLQKEGSSVQSFVMRGRYGYGTWIYYGSYSWTSAGGGGGGSIRAADAGEDQSSLAGQCCNAAVIIDL